MSNIQNTPVCNEPYVQKVRGAMQHRAQWLHLILDEARKQGKSPAVLGQTRRWALYPHTIGG